MSFRILFTRNVPETGKNYVECACNSSDTKVESDDFVQGSLLHIIDTGEVDAYDESAAAGSKWVEQLKFKEE